MAASIVALLLGASAASARSLPPGNSGVDEYTPSVPGPGGPTALGGGGGHPDHLPGSVRARLRGADGPLLARIATSPALGAPGAGAGRGSHGDRAAASSGGNGASARSGASAGKGSGSLAAAVGDAAGDSSVWPLLGAMAVVAAAGFAALSRRRGGPRARSIPRRR